MSGRLRTRIQARRRDERGTLLVEALMMMTVISIVSASYVGVNAAVQASMRHHQAVDVVDQYTTGLLEEVQALPWASVALCDHANTVPDNQVQYVGTCPARTVDPTSTKTIQGVTVTSTATVTWDDGSTSRPPAAFGRKVITLVSTFTPIGSDQTRTVRIAGSRTATPNEAPPTTIPESRQ